MEGLFGQTERDPAHAAVGGPGWYAQVALEQGLEKPEGLTYFVPAEMGELKVGDRVVVPLGKGNKLVGGYVLSVSDHAELETSKLKPVAARDQTAVNLPDELVELARWISRYYCCPLGMVFAAMLPAAVKRGTGLVKQSYADLVDPVAPSSVESVIEHHKLRGKQAAVLRKAAELHEAGRLPMDPLALAHEAGAQTRSPVQGLVKKGLMRLVKKSRVQAIWERHAAEAPAGLTLTGDQRRALDAVERSLGGGFGVHLLRGVTGSGKTEVYIRAIERCVERGQTAIVLVPEIALTPQTVGRFLGRLANVAVLHSGLTAAQRHEQWQAIRSGWAQVVVGARSAVFAPIEKLGLIVVDEEHDGSYKQDQAPRYHGRDVAIKRAQMAGATVLLGSATPSLESYHNATGRGAFSLLELPRRVADQPLPAVRIADMMDERRKRYQMTGKGGVHLLSLTLEKALQRTFQDGGQAMLLLNRRGYANYIACPDHRCGWVKTCEHCDANMVYHVDRKLPAGGLVRCHYCSYENLLPNQCPVCGRRVTPFGLGTQRVEDEIARKFPEITVARMDSDTMRSAKDYEATLGAFRRGETELLVGTQMIAKGLDFPNVRLVGVISADTALNLPDFRAAERTFQLVAQVAGRSGRSAKGGEVVVQTFTPEHPAVQLAAKHDYLTFAQQELACRRDANLPPASRMARIVHREQELEKCEGRARELAEVLRATQQRLGVDARVLGPMPAPIARIGDYHRQQIEMFADDAPTIQKLLAAVREAGLLRSDLHTAVDVDPISLM